MSMQNQIEKKLSKAFSPLSMQLVNESGKHSGPATESHWNLILVSEAFTGKNRVQRQRAVNAALREELDGRIHALTMKTLSPNEWEAAEGRVDNTAPKCGGGHKR